MNMYVLREIEIIQHVQTIAAYLMYDSSKFKKRSSLLQRFLSNYI